MKGTALAAILVVGAPLAGCGGGGLGAASARPQLGAVSVKPPCTPILSPTQRAPVRSGQAEASLDKIQADASSNPMAVHQKTVVCGTAWLADHHLARSYPVNLVGLYGPSSSRFVAPNDNRRFAFVAALEPSRDRHYYWLLLGPTRGPYYNGTATEAYSYGRPRLCRCRGCQRHSA